VRGYLYASLTVTPPSDLLKRRFSLQLQLLAKTWYHGAYKVGLYEVKKPRIEHFLLCETRFVSSARKDLMFTVPSVYGPRLRRLGCIPRCHHAGHEFMRIDAVDMKIKNHKIFLFT
jgi:hypothetical protein